MQPKVSVIICTRDRAESLRQTLAAMAAVRVPAGLSVELLVVDNGSRDDTAAVVARSAVHGGLPFPVRHVFEPTPGQCHARNRGLATACGDVILFTDDDVRPPADWVETMSRPILDGETDAVVGGVVNAPHLLRPWMTQLHRACLAETARLAGDVPPELVGANMAFGRHVLGLVPKFDTALGPGALGFADESLFSLQLVAAGLRIGRRLDSAVEHHFDPRRLSRRDWRRIGLNMGRSWGYVAHHWFQQKPAPNLRMPVKRSLRLLWMRATRPWEWIGRREGMPEWELHLLIDIGSWWWQWRNRHLPRHYPARNLGGVADRPVNAAGTLVN